MVDLGVNIFFGVLSGVLTSALIFLVRKIYLRVFLPWYEDRLYKGVQLDGKWEGETNDFKFLFELVQNGYRIKGLFGVEVKSSKPEDQYENLYKIKGHISDNYVVLEYWTMSRKRTGLGSFLLRVQDGGKKLMGSVVFVEEGEMDVNNITELVLRRKEN